MMNFYTSCKLCPRNCGVNRLSGETGFCGETAALRIGAAVIHFGEEPPLVGFGGSGTIFISGCNLGCSFCQNYQISQGSPSLGSEVSSEKFAEICAALRDKGAENINIVTGSHAIPAIAEGFIAAKNAGVKIPALWNSSGYENTEALELLRDHIDIYLPDLKTLDS
ncbi:MAG: radical SAM protein, partial [Treponema sp.]|nr:radical SAM protein [Treponema sp.]